MAIAYQPYVSKVITVAFVCISISAQVFDSGDEESFRTACEELDDIINLAGCAAMTLSLNRKQELVKHLCGFIVHQ